MWLEIPNFVKKRCITTSKNQTGSTETPLQNQEISQEDIDFIRILQEEIIEDDIFSIAEANDDLIPVSYTHLTLPTKA